MNFLGNIVIITYESVISLYKILSDFLFTEITIADLTLTPMQIIGGGGIIVLLVLWLVKKIVPLV